MKVFSIVFSVGLMFILTGCVAQTNIQDDFRNIDLPTTNKTYIEDKNSKNYPIGSKLNCYVGNEMIRVEKYQKTITEKLDLNQASYRALLDFKHIRKNEIYEVKGKSISDNSAFFLLLFESDGYYKYLKIDADGNLISNNLYGHYGQVVEDNYFTLSNNKIFNIEKTSIQKDEQYLKGSFSYSILYNGKDANGIRLQYREYKDDMARVAFYQDLTYDLKESKVIRFKNLKLEILKATNEAIEYKVLED